MPLVDYSDSEESESSRLGEHQIQGAKRKRTSETEPALPPLPETFHDLYASTARVSNQDDPTLHAGRQRVTPHVDGNWPTHVYIELHPSTEHSTRLNEILATVSRVQVPKGDRVHSLSRSDLGAALPLHISLSRPIVLLTDQRQPFIDDLTTGIQKSCLPPFEVSVTGLDWVANYEKTRWFLVMQLDRAPQNGLNELLKISNRVVQSFGQLPLYAEPQPLPSPRSQKRRKGRISSTSSSSAKAGSEGEMDMSSSFHISIGWTLTLPSQELVEALDRATECKDIKVGIPTVKAKIGNNITSIPLASRVDTSNTLIEKY